MYGTRVWDGAESDKKYVKTLWIPHFLALLLAVMLKPIFIHFISVYNPPQKEKNDRFFLYYRFRSRGYLPILAKIWLQIVLLMLLRQLITFRLYLAFLNGELFCSVTCTSSSHVVYSQHWTAFITTEGMPFFLIPPL